MSMMNKIISLSSVQDNDSVYHPGISKAVTRDDDSTKDVER